jgi:hypothetical protein
MPSSLTSAQDDAIAPYGQKFSPLRPKSTINKRKQGGWRESRAAKTPKITSRTIQTNGDSLLVLCPNNRFLVLETDTFAVGHNVVKATEKALQDDSPP